MNKEFVKKMIMAEKYRCEAIKELLPDTLKKKVAEFEGEVFEVLKDVALEMYSEKADAEKEAARKPAGRIDVDFS